MAVLADSLLHVSAAVRQRVLEQLRGEPQAAVAIKVAVALAQSLRQPRAGWPAHQSLEAGLAALAALCPSASGEGHAPAVARAAVLDTLSYFAWAAPDEAGWRAAHAAADAWGLRDHVVLSLLAEVDRRFDDVELDAATAHHQPVAPLWNALQRLGVAATAPVRLFLCHRHPRR